MAPLEHEHAAGRLDVFHGLAGADPIAGYDGAMGEFFDSLKDRAVFALMAVILGVQAGSFLSDPRPDPFTGTMAGQLEADMHDYVDFRIESLSRDVQEHIADAKEGYVRIRQLEVLSARESDKLSDLRERVAVLEGRK